MSAGQEDSVLIEVPKGSYHLAWRYRAGEPVPQAVPLREEPVPAPAPVSSGKLFAVGFAAAAVLATASVAIWEATRPDRLPQVVEAFWEPLLKSPQPPVIVFSNHRFTGTSVTGLHHFRDGLDSPADANDTYSGTGTVMAVAELSSLFSLAGHSSRLKRAELLTWDEARDANIVFVGSPEANSRLGEMALLRHFKFKSGFEEPRYGTGGIINVKPAAGEESIYFGSSNFQTTGFSQTTQMITSQNNNLTPFNTLSNPFPSGVAVPPGSGPGVLTGVGTSINGGLASVGSVPSFKDALNQQFSLGFQFVLPGKVSLETSYVGNNVQHLSISRNIDTYPVGDLALDNQLNAKVANPFYGVITNSTSALSQSTVALSQLLLPFPQFTGVTESSLPLGRSHYNSLQLMANKRFSQGFNLTVAYTFSKYLQNTAYHNIDDAAPESVIAGSDRPSEFVVSGLYELPFGPGKPFLQSSNPAIKRIVGGWQVSWTGTYTSGQALSFSCAERISTSSDNPNTVLHSFDTTQFAPQAPFTLQHTSSALANLRGPGIGMWHVDLAKDIPITERAKFRLEAHAFNFLNTPFFGNPNTTVTSASFGQITGLYSGSASRTFRSRPASASERNPMKRFFAGLVLLAVVRATGADGVDNQKVKVLAII